MTATYDGENFAGFEGTRCEHRTVGPHRAWCHDDGEWCYPDDSCRGCANATRMWVDRDLLREVRGFLASSFDRTDQGDALRLVDRLPDPDQP